MRWWTGSELITAEMGTPASRAGSTWSGVRLPKRVVVPHSMYAVVSARLGSTRAVSRAEVGALSTAASFETPGRAGLTGAAAVLNVASFPYAGGPPSGTT